MRDDRIFDVTQAELAYRTEEIYRARARSGNDRAPWWKLGRRTVTVPEQRRPSHDRRVSARDR
ncbi:hypothetical protein [Amycolatopsis pigmentata]|uniref:Uncharacterized protein n=1 Tax=Amycolatopsis pigmentata TaxID=450801 RepID=A0ABW5FV00_9PSEU